MKIRVIRGKKILTQPAVVGNPDGGHLSRDDGDAHIRGPGDAFGGLFWSQGVVSRRQRQAKTSLRIRADLGNDPISLIEHGDDGLVGRGAVLPWAHRPAAGGADGHQALDSAVAWLDDRRRGDRAGRSCWPQPGRAELLPAAI